jgi:cold shock CspA family protein
MPRTVEAGRMTPSKKPVRPQDRHGTPVTGRIVRILVGQGYGFIRLPNAREVYFHRADLHEGTTFNEFRIGDRVTFELLEDAISGARALHVVRRRRPE